MTKAQLKAYAESVGYPMELWRDRYTIAQSKQHIFNFFSHMAMYSAIGNFFDKEETRQKADKIEKELGL